LESPSARAERMARAMTIWGHVPTLEETVAKLDAVTVAGVRDFAAGICHNTKAAMALYGPVNAAPSLDELTAKLSA